ncbi:MAG: hypothetical protein V1853_03490 [bacterium]
MMRNIAAITLALLVFVGCTTTRPALENLETANVADVSMARPFLIGQGPIVDASGILIGDGDYLEGEDLDEFFQEIKLSFDAVELRIWTWFEGQNQFTVDTVNDFLARAHNQGVAVYLNCWEYPGTKHPPSEFQAYKLNDAGSLIPANFSDGQIRSQHFDKADPQAMAWFGEQLRDALAQFNEFDGFFIVEDRVSDWVSESWPQHVRYWDSPTYSQDAYQSFQSYLLLHNQPVRNFPVDRATLVNQYTELVPSGDPLWLSWYQWRFELMADYLEVVSSAVHTVNPDAPVVYMPWQRVIDEAPEVYDNDWNEGVWDVGFGPGVAENAIFGVSASTIAKRGSIDIFVVEYGEDGTHEPWPMSQNELATERVAEALDGSSVRLGSFAQFFNWSDMRVIEPELIAEEINMGLENGSRLIVGYDVATVYSKSGRYNEEVATFWKRVVAKDFKRFDSTMIAEVRESIGGRQTPEGIPDRKASTKTPPAEYYPPPGMPAGVASWYDQYDYVYVSDQALLGDPPYYVVAENWDNPAMDNAHQMDYFPGLGFAAIKRQDMTLKRFQVISQHPSGKLLWSKVGEVLCSQELDGVECRPNSWLYKPVPWKDINWDNAGLGEFDPVALNGN